MTRRPIFLAAIATVALVVFIYTPVRHFEFVTFDDYDFVVDKPQVAAGLTADSMRWAWTNAYDAAGGPLTWLSHMLDVELFGMTPGPHHVHNVVLHAMSSVLLLVVLWQATGSTWRSAFVAGLFAVHPLHVESVAWIAERKDTLSALFWMLTMWTYVRYARQPGTHRYALVVVTFALGLLAKPMNATLPLVLLLLDVWPLGRVAWAWADRARWKALVIEKLPLVALAAGSLAWILTAQRGIGAVVTLDALPLSTRLANAVISLATYVQKMIWPSGLAAFYPYPRSWSWWPAGASLAILLVISLVAWRQTRPRPYLAAGWLWFVVTMIPVIGLVQVGSHGMADRFTYIPAVGVFIIAAWGGFELFEKNSGLRRAAPVTAACIVIAFTIVARVQVGYWRTSEAMWGRALDVTAGNFRAHAGLADVRAAGGRLDDAIAHYSEALRLAPDEAEWHENLAELFVRKGDVDKAAASFADALRIRPDRVEALNNLGAMRARQGQMAEAARLYSRALEIRPGYAFARRNRGLVRAAQGDVTGGLTDILDAIRQAPSEASWHYDAAVLLLAQNDVAGARTHLQETLRLDPSHQPAREALAAIRK